MTGNAQGTEQKLGGEMFLYSKPELLNPAVHGKLGLNRPTKPFEFARKAISIPLTLAELPTAQKFYPIVFSDLENAVPLAVVGLSGSENLFVDETGHWADRCYVPAYARCYPFALASAQGDQHAVVIDRAAEMISENPEHPFFNGDAITQYTQNLVNFAGQLDFERSKTKVFGKKLAELGVLAGQQVMHKTTNGEERQFATYVGVDAKKLAELDSAVLKEMTANGYLAGVFAHLFSMNNWQDVAQRRDARAATT